MFYVFWFNFSGKSPPPPPRPFHPQPVDMQHLLLQGRSNNGGDGLKKKSEQCPWPYLSPHLFWQRDYCKRRLWSAHIAPSTSIRVEASLQRSAALRGQGALKSAVGSSFSHDVRDGERWVVLRNWVHAILLRHLQLSRQRRWTAYPRSCKWCRTQAHFDPTPLGGDALSASLRFGFVGKRRNLASVGARIIELY